jgi:hypothetical protein
LSPAIEDRFRTFLTCAALLTFAWLTTRHVGESAFLEDQVDQLQNFESLLQLRPEGLWGAVMSGTTPPARALGPLGGVVFGLPVALGFGIDAIHLTTSVLIALATAACFLLLARIDAASAWLWLFVFSATGLVWWNAGILWSNTLLLPCGLVIAALSASCLWRPRMATLIWLALTALFALQLHLVAVVAAPVIAIVAAITLRDARQRLPGRLHTWVLAVMALLAVGPYLLAEGLTGGQNTRAILTELGTGSGTEPVPSSATMALAIATDPMRVAEWLGVSLVPAIACGLVLSIATVVWLGRLRRGTPGDRSERVLFELALCGAAAIIGQAVYFFWMARPFAGYHHVTLLAPFYALIPAAVLRRAAFGPSVPRRAIAVLGTVVLAALLLAGPSMSDRFVERTPWSYSRIRAALEALCSQTGVDTDEGQGFAALLTPRYDGVMRYLINRRFVSCRYEPSSDILIAAARDAQYPQSRTIGTTQYRLELVLPPGIARYRKWP